MIGQPVCTLCQSQAFRRTPGGHSALHTTGMALLIAFGVILCMFGCGAILGLPMFIIGVVGLAIPGPRPGLRCCKCGVVYQRG